MATITEDYVSFETAKLLKEKGFQAKCTACYRSDLNNTFELISGRINYCNPRFSKYKSIPPYNAPTLQMAIKWLREEHKINIEIHYNRFGENHRYLIIYKPEVLDDIRSLGDYYSYEEAAEAAIKYCLEILI